MSSDKNVDGGKKDNNNDTAQANTLLLDNVTPLDNRYLMCDGSNVMTNNLVMNKKNIVNCNSLTCNNLVTNSINTSSINLSNTNIHPIVSGFSMGTSTEPFHNLYLRGTCYVNGDQVKSSKYSTYSDVKIENVSKETIISNGKSTGSLKFIESLALGTIIEINMNFTVNTLTGDELLLKIYSNKAMLFSHSIEYNTVTNSYGNIDVQMTVRDGGRLQISAIRTISGFAPIISKSNVPFNRLSANTFSVTGEWQIGAASTFVCDQLNISSQFKK